jgi:transposase
VYSIDFRRHVLKIGEKEGLSIRALADRFCIASRSIVNWKKKLAPIVKLHRRPRTVCHEALKEDLKQYPDAYHQERAERLGVSKSGIYHALKRLKVTYKKNSQSSQSQSRKAIYILPSD